MTESPICILISIFITTSLEKNTVLGTIGTMAGYDKVFDLFLLLLCDAVDRDQAVKDSAGFTPDDWERLFSLSLASGLLPAFYGNISRLHLPDIPPRIADENKILFLHNLKKNACAEKELLAVLSCLQKNGIPAIALKGPVLARLVTGDLSYRQASCDIDILVAPEEKEKTVGILEGAGYFFSEKDHAPDFFYKYRTGMMLQKRQPEADPVNLDLHWGFRDRFIPGPLKEFRAGAHLVPYLDTQVLVPRNEDLFIFLVLTAFSDFDFVLPKYLYDIHRLLSAGAGGLDWADIREKAGQYGLSCAVFFALSLSVDVFKTPLPPGVRERFTPSLWKRALCGRCLTKEAIFLRRQKMAHSYLWRYPLNCCLLTSGLTGALSALRKKIFISIDEVVVSQPASRSTPGVLYLKRLLKPFFREGRNS